MTSCSPKIRLLFKCLPIQYKTNCLLGSYFIHPGYTGTTVQSKKSHYTSIVNDGISNKNDGNIEDTSKNDNSSKLPEFSKSILTNATSLSDLKPSSPDDVWASSAYPFAQKINTEEERIRRTKIEPKEKTIIMFPGQGSQHVGMGKNLLSIPNVLEMYKIASEIVGYDVLKLCLEGPQEKLNETKYSQIALLVTSLASLEKLQHKSPEAVENCVTTMGFSVGEFAALVFAGVISFEEAVRLVHLRGEAMQAASDLVPSGMTTLIFAPEPQVPLILEAACKWALQAGVEEPVCSVANTLFPNCKVVAGHLPALKFIEDNIKDLRIRSAKRLPVSGAFHTALMEPAMEAWKLALEQVDFQTPIINIHSNVDGKPHKLKTMKEKLVKHLVSPVKWEQTLSYVYERSNGVTFPSTYECGPGTSLKAILRRKNMKSWESTYCVGV